ncbi:hypothetical protein DKX38_006025 [Salix brachista]|uniref:Uncharacterized protein n=1 Tax=Salix brachista TaxID=2182728 RepID=A0A5N5N233_9ROSI|nr:hypothetical protein DKX38_006025 [Salix brachista]
MDSCNTGFQAGQAKGQAQEKTSQFMDKASNAAQSAMESCQEVQDFFSTMLIDILLCHLLIFTRYFELQTGQQMKNKAQEAAETVKSKVGTDK